ncbi:protein YgfX [Salinisphaera sp. SPP-AMP-43]|uniref:protein YgfX n=1 Tax=Salinisphaera sp. SPP-AMP-43 TaxID=3121288 RepID=UPI003C6E2392
MPRFDDTIHVTLRPSPMLRIGSALVHSVAVGVAVALAWAIPEFAILAAVLAVAAWRADRRFRLCAPGVCTAFRWSADHHVHWQRFARAPLSGRCIEARSWGALWVRLKWRGDAHRRAHTIVIPADAVDSDLHRRLRARCRVAPPSDAG